MGSVGCCLGDESERRRPSRLLADRPRLLFGDLNYYREGRQGIFTTFKLTTRLFSERENDALTIVLSLQPFGRRSCALS